MRTNLGIGLIAFFFFFCNSSIGVCQEYFNAWLTSDSHLIGLTGNVQSLQLAVNQAKGRMVGAPNFSWDIQIDAGDLMASQTPPNNEEGIALAKNLNKTLGKDRGRFFTISGNHDGEGKGWNPGEFTRRYINPLGKAKFFKSSGFLSSQRPNREGYRQLLKYSGTRWDRYLVRTGNMVWIMLADRNEYDSLAEQRGDTSGRYQAGRGSASGMPDGGYPSGAVALDTFKWWKKVVEDPKFSDDILITVHHLLPANTTIDTEDGEPGDYHGKTGSIGPNGEVGGQLYWIREYNDQGKEIVQYAQTRPFLDYLRDHLGAISIWIGGHTHINAPESKINGRGMYVRKYGTTFLNVGALTDSHAGRANQMTRMLTFQDGKDEAMLNVYIHQSTDGHSIGWYEPATRRVSLGNKFVSPDSTTNVSSLYEDIDKTPTVPEAPNDPIKPRYYWNLNEDQQHDFNNKTYVVGADGSPYGNYQGIDKPIYIEDSPMKSGRSLDLRQTNGRIQLNKPYQPEMKWPSMTLSIWLRTNTTDPQEVISYSSASETGKFRLWYDGSAWVWDVAQGADWRSAQWETKAPNNGQWHHFVATVDSKRNCLQLYADGDLVAKERWLATSLNTAPAHQFVIGASGDRSDGVCMMRWSRPFNGLVDELIIYDAIINPKNLYPILYKNDINNFSH